MTIVIPSDIQVVNSDVSTITYTRVTTNIATTATISELNGDPN